jgi:N-acetylneuraminic acid mutarotase
MGVRSCPACIKITYESFKHNNELKQPHVKNSAYLLLLLIALNSCKKENEYKFPLIFTGNVTDISSTGAVFNAKITDLSTQEITGYGFVWSSNPKPDIGNSEKIVISDSPKTGEIRQVILTTLQTGVKYYVRAFISNSSYITYGKEVTFKSLGSQAPLVNDFYPKTANLKDTVTIFGKNFSYILSNDKVTFGTFSATLIYASQDSLKVIVPEKLNLTSCKVSVSILGNERSSAEYFSLIPPVLDDFNDKTATFRSQVIIKGQNFMSNPSTISVWFDKFKVKILSISEKSITVLVPDSLNQRECNIKIRMNNIIVSSAEKFRLTSMSVLDFTPKIALTGSTIKITGINFSIIPQNNIVTFGGLKAAITKASFNELEVILPLQDIGFYPSRNVKVNVEVVGENHDLIGTLLINDKWFRHSTPPLDFLDSFTAIAGNRVYLGINGNKGFWVYDPEINEFKQLANFPGTARSGGTGFAIGNKIYFGTGSLNYNNYKDFWEYDIPSDVWHQKSDFPGTSRGGSIAFSINANGYLGGGVHDVFAIYKDPFDDFWKYYPVNDKWSRIPSFNNGADSSSVFGMSAGVSVVEGNEAYVGLGWNYIASDVQDRRWFVYDATANSWRRLANYPVSRVYQNAIAFNFNGIPYVKTVGSDFYSFNRSANSWDKVISGIIPNVSSGIGFATGNIAYVGVAKAFWEYDPYR